MSEFEKLFPKDLYHSYVIEGEPEKTGLLLLKFLEKRGDIESQSPDVLFQIYESFTMEDSEEIKNWHSKYGISKSKKVCIIATKFINREAEQTLLKIIEEPAEGTHFFIIVPDSSLLLPTILSRVQLIKITKGIDEDKEISKKALSFLTSTPKNRIDMVASIIKENKDEENSGQLRYYAISFLNELESIIYQKFKKDKGDKKIEFSLNEIGKCREYLSVSGASVKMILEHIALVI